MKKSNFKFSVFLVLFTLMFLCANAQNTNEDTYIINQYFQLNKEASLLENKIPLSSHIQSFDNIVLLNQTGNNNQILVKSNPNNSQAISQKGNDNYYNFINYYNSTSSNFKILQKGNSNSLQIYGSNSIVKNLKVSQNGGFKAVIIKNY